MARPLVRTGLTAGFVALSLVSGCSLGDRFGGGGASPVAARVGGRDVSRAELETLAAYRDARRPGATERQPDLEAALQDWIAGWVLQRELSERGLDASPEYQKRLTAIRARARSAEQQLARKTLLEALERDLVFSDEELRARYEAERDRFLVTRLHLRQITVPERETILGIRKQIDEGTPFEALARQVNLDPALRDRGGDLGWLDQRRIPSAIVGAAHRLVQDGEVSEPFRDREGRWNLVQLVSRERGVRRSFDEVRDRLTRELRVIRGRELLDERLAASRGELTVERLDAELFGGAGSATPAGGHAPE